MEQRSTHSGFTAKQRQHHHDQLLNGHAKTSQTRHATRSGFIQYGTCSVWIDQAKQDKQDYEHHWVIGTLPLTRWTGCIHRWFMHQDHTVFVSLNPHGQGTNSSNLLAAKYGTSDHSPPQAKQSLTQICPNASRSRLIPPCKAIKWRATAYPPNHDQQIPA